MFAHSAPGALLVYLTIPTLTPDLPSPRGAPDIPNRKQASPYPQLERGRSVSPTGKGPVHISNKKAISPTGKEPMNKHGLGLSVKSGPKVCPARAWCADAPPQTRPHLDRELVLRPQATPLYVHVVSSDATHMAPVIAALDSPFLNL